MRSELYKNIMTLYFVGELNSYNADDIDKEIDEAFAGKTFDTVNLDFSGLKYISSAGLRVILKIKQKYPETHIIEASLEVYDVLNMTGFTNIMDVKKALKVIDVSNAQVIGEGFFSTVYRINKDTIVKVFKRTSDAGQIERELRLAKQAFVLGIPTAIASVGAGLVLVGLTVLIWKPCVAFVKSAGGLFGDIITSIKRRIFG